MCGISGLFNWDGVSDTEITRVNNSLAAMKYRGPDFSNIQSDIYAVLGHNRLSILDLNPRSNQPMKSKDNRYSIVFNGEIYNYLEIKKDLISNGVVFFSTSDTEVLLEGYAFYGEKIVNKLRGMFAFVIWDAIKKEIFIARDRFGEKPFYYNYIENKTFCFASNLKGIVSLVNFDLTINKQALFELLSYQYIDKSVCIYNNIQKLEPGTYATIKKDSFLVKEYWNPNYKDKTEVDFSESLQKIENLLESAVQEQLEADVPVGLFLSGGVDSSVVAALASKSKNDITALTMSVPGSKVYDESESAAYVTKKLKIKHKIVPLDSTCVQNLPYILSTMEPLADASLIPSMAIAKEAKKEFTVMLSGDGGDEIFGGYSKPTVYNQSPFKGNWMTQIMVNNIVKHSDGYPFNYLFSKMNDKRYFQWGGLDSYFKSKGIVSKKMNVIKSINSNFENKLLYYYKESEKYCAYEADKLLYVGVKSNLTNDFLFKMDSANMYYSVESRAPFLDHRLLDFTSKLSVNQLMSNGIDKEILKKIGSKYLSEDFFKLPKKGFSIPYYDYLKNTWGDLLIQFVNEGISADLLESNLILEMLKNYRKKPTYGIGKVLYSILVFEIWLRVFHLKLDPKEINLL